MVFLTLHRFIGLSLFQRFCGLFVIKVLRLLLVCWESSDTLIKVTNELFDHQRLRMTKSASTSKRKAEQIK